MVLYRFGWRGEASLRNPCVAHRGWSGAAPENTLASLRLAAEAEDVEWAEIDVQLSRDGVPFLLHDKRLGRTAMGGGRRIAERLAAGELAKLDAGGWFSSGSSGFKGERVPTLEQALRETGDRLCFNIEIKVYGSVDTGLERSVVEVIERCGMRHRTVLTSFSRDSLRRIRRLQSGIPVGMITKGWHSALPQELEELGCSLLSAKYSVVNRDRLRLLKQLGIRTMVWTLDDFRLIRSYALMDPSLLICTNYPDRWREALRSLPRPHPPAEGGGGHILHWK